MGNHAYVGHDGEKKKTERKKNMCEGERRTENKKAVKMENRNVRKRQGGRKKNTRGGREKL